MKETIALRKRFCKDYNLPINLFDSPYFEQRLAALDSQFNCVSLYGNYMEEVSQFTNEEAYFAEYNRVKDTAIQSIQLNSRYTEFTNSKVPVLGQFPKKELYSDCNDGKTFYSIDMKKANFTILRRLYPYLIGYADTWEEFMRNFTPLTHIITSKYIRQVILGACCPKKQTQWEKFLMENLSMSIESRLNLCHIISVNTDEILIESESPCSMSAMHLRSIIDQECYSMSDLVKVSKFKLKKIDGFGWIKQFIHESSLDELSGDYEFKCVDADKFHILAKLYTNQELTDDDMVFRHNGMLAKYVDKGLFKI